MKEKICIASCGSSKFKIVLPDAATPPERFAAEELQKYIAASAGVTLPIAAEEEAGEPGIFIGGTRAFAALGISTGERELNYDGFVIAASGGRVFVQGACGRGVVYGVCEFAERYLGVRFLSPGETLVPARDTVDVEEGVRICKPVFRFRNFYDGGLFFTIQNPDYADTLYGVHRRMFSD